MIPIDSTFDMVVDLAKALSSADIIFIQNNNSRMLQEFRKHAKESIKSGTIVFDFWNVINEEDLPANTVLISHGKGQLNV